MRKIKNMTKILTILGARPQFIKAGSFSRAISNYEEIEEIIVHTGQHYDENMSDVFFKEMQIPRPNYLLGIGGKNHGAMIGQMIEKIEEIAIKENPDWVIVFGDTNSTLAGSIVASKLNFKLAHIEAGLRSFNMNMPEEVNRILTDRVSNILFCPTDIAVKNLKNEGYGKFNSKIVKSGDVMLDGAIFYNKLAVKPNIETEEKFILCTIHRAENTNDEKRLRSIFKALKEIAKDRQVILPIHPRTKNVIEKLELCTDNLTIIQPVGYLEMVWLIKNCTLVMTDSGGLQKEAYFFKKQCITLRDETEWVELVESGANVLVGANEKKILNAAKEVSIFNPDNFNNYLYGNGNASKIIIDEIIKYSETS